MPDSVYGENHESQRRFSALLALKYSSNLGKFNLLGRAEWKIYSRSQIYLRGIEAAILLGFMALQPLGIRGVKTISPPIWLLLIAVEKDSFICPINISPTSTVLAAKVRANLWLAVRKKAARENYYFTQAQQPHQLLTRGADAAPVYMGWAKTFTPTH